VSKHHIYHMVHPLLRSAALWLPGAPSRQEWVQAAKPPESGTRPGKTRTGSDPHIHSPYVSLLGGCCDLDPVELAH
jgi:hypothetical protein